MTRARLAGKRSEKVTELSFSLAAQALRKGGPSRNEARRRLVKEVTRRYGKLQATIMGPRLVSRVEGALYTAQKYDARFA